MPPDRERRLGDILVSADVLSREELHRGLERQKNTGRKLGRILVDVGLITDAELAEALSAQLGIPHVRFSEHDPAADAVLRLPERLAVQRRVLCLDSEDDTYLLAMANPLDVSILDQVRMIVDGEVRPAVAPQDKLKRAIRRAYGGGRTLDRLVDQLSDGDVGSVSRSESDPEGDLDAGVHEAPVVRYVDMLLREAVDNGASDIHLEPFRDELRVRRRIDGVLQELEPPPEGFRSAIVSRIKVMADMDIARSRLPQDGRIRVRSDGRAVDFRVNCFPTVFGESIVLRVLNRGHVALRIDNLGMTDRQEKRYRRIVQRPNGMVLVSGRTGAGKTTTLYSGLNLLNDSELKIVTLEDPVEYRLDGLVQTQVSGSSGYTFAGGMRAMLRHDPDVCLVGEIRDNDTARTAVQAALTGHLVLSTTHTNRAAGAVARLVNMGVEPFLLSSTLQAVLGQCLVRLICDRCRERYRPEPENLRRLGKSPGRRTEHTFTRGAGCEACGGTGYRSRTGLFELLEVTPEVARLVSRDAPADVIHTRALEEGMLPLREHGWRTAIEGKTTVEEVLRVVPRESTVDAAAVSRG